MRGEAARGWEWVVVELELRAREREKEAFRFWTRLPCFLAGGDEPSFAPPGVEVEGCGNRAGLETGGGPSGF